MEVEALMSYTAARHQGGHPDVLLSCVCSLLKVRMCCFCLCVFKVWRFWLWGLEIVRIFHILSLAKTTAALMTM